MEAIRESIITSRFMFKRSKILSFDVILSSMFPIFSLGVRISMIYYMIVFPITILYFTVIIMFMAFFRNIPLIFEEKGDIIYNILYGFLHTSIVYWLYFPALYSVFMTKNRAWGTR